MPARTPLEAKVTYGTLAGSVALVTSVILVLYVFKSLPFGARVSLPGFTTLLVGYLGGYMAPHTPRLAEVVEAVEQVLDDWPQAERHVSPPEADSELAPTAVVPPAPAYGFPWEPAHEITSLPAVSAAELVQEDPFAGIATEDDR